LVTDLAGCGDQSFNDSIPGHDSRKRAVKTWRQVNERETRT